MPGTISGARKTANIQTRSLLSEFTELMFQGSRIESDN